MGLILNKNNERKNDEIKIDAGNTGTGAIITVTK